MGGGEDEVKVVVGLMVRLVIGVWVLNNLDKARIDP